MKNGLIAILVVALGILVLHETFLIVNRERVAWAESNFIVSPSKKWAVDLQTTSTDDPSKSFCRILLFDTRMYPDIVKRNSPIHRERNNPTASFLLPLQLYARIATVEFNAEESRVAIKQGQVNKQAPINVELDLYSFSLKVLNPDTVEPCR